ncbi:glycosyltransferase involved in cell wall biosynthesis [Azospirillum brasilense]|nr:glycosyltransferase involved in cell wall biosynthesis [Azospirillum brasilense]
MAGQSRVVGSLDAVTLNSRFGYVLSGWACDVERVDAKVCITIQLDGQCIATSAARYFRPDLVGGASPDGFNAFSILIPMERLPDRAARTFYVFGNGERIGGASIEPVLGHGTMRGPGAFGLAPDQWLVDALGEVAFFRGGGVFDAHWYERAYPGVTEWCRETGAPSHVHYLLLGRSWNYLPHVPINAAWYLERYGAVIAGMRGIQATTAADHYYVGGGVFGFDAVPGFDEQSYLRANGDVAGLVEQRRLVSGYQHYLVHGSAEGRVVAPWGRLPQLSGHDFLQTPAFAGLMNSDPVGGGPSGRNWTAINAMRLAKPSMVYDFAEDLYRVQRPDVAEAIAGGLLASGVEHWLDYGLAEDLAGTVPRLPGYCEHRYLVNNPDVSEAVSSGAMPSGYHHFLGIGHKEKRQGGLEPGTPVPRPVPSADILRRIAGRKGWPTISIVMPVYQTPERWLQAAVGSVLEQLYPFWELCIVDDASPDPRIREQLAAFAARDPRIRVVCLPDNGGIAAASNVALSLAEGEWIALLDHDDQLTPDALYEVAAAIVEHDPDVVYSDEDKMSVDGRFYDATHKPGWSPELLRSTMYIGHLTCYRTAVVRQAGGFRSAYDGTQDYDLALRVAGITDRFVHVPKILYHWVAIPGSTADVLSAKSYAVERQKKAIEEAVAVQAVTPFEVRPHWSPGNWRVVYDPPAPAPLVSIVIPSAGRMGEIFGMQVDILKSCVMSLIGSECYENYEVIVVHNGELAESTLRFLRAVPNVREFNCRRPSFNFSERVNLGVEQARGDHVLLLNDDVQAISRHFLRDMLGLVCQPGVGAVGPRLLFANGTLQHVGILMLDGVPTHGLIGEHRLTPGPQGIAQVTHNAVAATAACLLVSRKLYWEVGGFDTGLCLNYNDVDFCNRIRSKGLRIVIDPAIELYHFESLSKEGTFNWELQKFVRRWGITPDPYLNPNFSTANPFYSLARDPAARPVRGVEEQIVTRIAASRTRPSPGDTTPGETIRFSIFMSIYRQPIRFLREIEKTILNQFYRNFEWVIVSDGDHRPELLEWLREVSAHDAVKVIISPENQGIMAGYGMAFRETTGDYVLPVDADDFLTLDALQVMAEHIHSHGFPAALYSDEFKSDPQSRLLAPFHKPDFDRVLHMNICFTCHLCALRRDVAVEVGAYTDRRATWSHDWDTFTRVERAGYGIVHVPHLLYAWRINPGSTASLESGTKPDAVNSQRHVLDQHLARTKLDRKLAVVPNTLFPHPGIWRLAPVGEGLRVTVVVEAGSVEETIGTVQALAGQTPAGQTSAGWPGTSVRVLAASPEEAVALATHLASLGSGRVSVRTGPVAAVLAEACESGDGVAFVQAGCKPLGSDGLVELAGLLNGVEEAVAIGGRVLDTDGRIAWAGGFFGIGGFLATADYGRDAADAGYHGMLFCQRFVDGVSPSHWLVRSDFLRRLLRRTGPDIAAARIASAIALRAHADDARVLYTPFSVWRLSKPRHIQPPVLPAVAMAELEAAVPSASRWYSPRLHSSAAHGYRPRGYG